MFSVAYGTTEVIQFPLFEMMCNTLNINNDNISVCYYLNQMNAPCNTTITIVRAVIYKMLL